MRERFSLWFLITTTSSSPVFAGVPSSDPTCMALSLHFLIDLTACASLVAFSFIFEINKIELKIRKNWRMIYLFLNKKIFLP
jgi:hypothetical protein